MRFLFFVVFLWTGSASAWELQAGGFATNRQLASLQPFDGSPSHGVMFGGDLQLGHNVQPNIVVMGGLRYAKAPESHRNEQDPKMSSITIGIRFAPDWLVAPLFSLRVISSRVSMLDYDKDDTAVVPKSYWESTLAHSIGLRLQLFDHWALQGEIEMEDIFFALTTRAALAYRF